MLPRDFTKQENLIAEALSECGLRYDQQVAIKQYTADFFIAELGLVIEADGIYGHSQNRDTYRDSELMHVFGVENILHIKDNSAQGVRDTLWLALNNLTNK